MPSRECAHARLLPAPRLNLAVGAPTSRRPPTPRRPLRRAGVFRNAAGSVYEGEYRGGKQNGRGERARARRERI